MLACRDGLANRRHPGMRDHRANLLDDVFDRAAAAERADFDEAHGSGPAEEKCFAQGVNGATLTWGVSDRFRAYVTGPIAKGSVSTSGVRDNGTTFTWSGGKGSFNTDLGKGRASYGGTVSFSGHEGILDLRIANPRVAPTPTRHPPRDGQALSMAVRTRASAYASAAARCSSSVRSRSLRVRLAARSNSARASSLRPSLPSRSPRTLGSRW